MSLLEDISRDCKEAMKSRDGVTLDTLRFLKSAFHNREIEKKGKGEEGPLTDSEALEVMKREVKKRKEAFDMYVSAGRNDLAEKERAELSVIERYLPPQASDEEIEKAVSSALSRFPQATTKDFGSVMGLVMKELKGNAEALRVSKVIKEKLGS